MAIRPVALRRPLIFAYIKDFGASNGGPGSFVRLHPLGGGLGLLWSSGSNWISLLMVWGFAFDSNASHCVPGLEGISDSRGRNLSLMEELTFCAHEWEGARNLAGDGIDSGLYHNEEI